MDFEICLYCKHSIWLVTCDNCGKTMRTTAATERTALQTAENKGWRIVKNTYVYCPKCRMGKVI